MFETADAPQAVDEETYETQVPLLRHALLDVQRRLRAERVSGLLLFAGVEKAGTGDAVNVLNSWMDPRWLDTLAYGPPTEEERARPRFWRYWRDMPPNGELGVRLAAWYRAPLLARVAGKLDEDGFARALDEIAAFEELLAADGMVIVKFWMHLGKAAQKARLEALAADPLQAWRVDARDWAQWKQHAELIRAGEEMLLRTSTGHAPWHIIEGSDPHYRHLRVGNIVLAALEHRLASSCEPTPQPEVAPIAAEVGDAIAESSAEAAAGSTEAADDRAPEAAEPAEPAPTPIRPRSLLRDVDMGKNVSKGRYEKDLARLQGQLNQLQRRAQAAGVSLVAVFEGWDAAGKGGAIRRMTAALDARHYRVLPFAAPTDEERARHYLWRFWRHLGGRGSVTIFDRSWYGRVLVERIEGFATAAEWQRAYAEINHFERQLVEAGVVVVKFWLHITEDEQAERFDERANTPYKQWKITDEDWRNRARWHDYEFAVHDMIERTSTARAPWVVVPGNHKRRARLVVLRSVCAALEARLPPEPAAPKTEGKAAPKAEGKAAPKAEGKAAPKAEGKAAPKARKTASKAAPKAATETAPEASARDEAAAEAKPAASRRRRRGG